MKPILAHTYVSVRDQVCFCLDPVKSIASFRAGYNISKSLCMNIGIWILVNGRHAYK